MIRLLVVAIVLGIVHLLLYRGLARATALPRTGRRAVAVALVVGWIVAVVGSEVGTALDPATTRPIGRVGWTWLAVVFYLALGLLVVALGRLSARLLRRSPPPVPDTTRDTPSTTGPSRRGVLRGATAAVAVAALGTTAYGVAEAARPRVLHRALTFDRLPAGFDGTRIALVSDLHVGPARGAEFVRTVVDAVGSERPDLVVLAGDLTDGTVALVGPDLAPLRDLRAPLGVFGVAGNHEGYTDDVDAWLDHWETLGVTTLRNRRVPLARGGDTIELAGVYDYAAPAPHGSDLDAALHGVEPDRFVVLAAHQPRDVEAARRHRVDLQLSGHTHGGQMWPVPYIVAAVQPTVAGESRFGGTTLFTSRGAGAWGPPVRVGAPPDIAILELRRT